MARLTAGDHVSESDTEAAFPIWRVTVTPVGGSARQWANVLDSPFTPRILKIGAIIRQSIGATSRGTVKVEVSNIDSGSGRASDLSASERWEGAALEIRVLYGVVNSIVFSGNVEEVSKLDELEFAFSAKEGRSWLDGEALDPITLADWAEAPAASLDHHRPVVLGVVPNWTPPLVEGVSTTSLTTSMTSTATTAEVDSTEGFPSAGTIKVDAETMTFAGKTGTTFTGLVRSAPVSHVPGDAVVEVGTLTYLVADHNLHATSAISNVRLKLSNGGLAPVPADVTVTKVVTGGKSTVALSKQPEILASQAAPSAFKFVDLDTVVHSDLSAADAAKCIGLADGFVDVDRSILTAAGVGTGGKRAAAIDIPADAIVERAWIVVEHFQETEAETTLNGLISSGATTLVVPETSAFAASGHVIIESGTQTAELVSYSGKTATSFTGVVRGLNSTHQAAVTHPDGARVSWSDGIVHLDLAGGDASTANTLGALQTKQIAPEEVVDGFFPSVHEFDAQHTHEIVDHDHGAWDTAHGHLSDNAFRVFPLAIYIDPAKGGGSASEFSGFMPGVGMPFDAGPKGEELSGFLATSDYENTNWYALVFDPSFFEGDTRRVVGCDAFVMAASTGPMRKTVNGVPSGATNPSEIPYFGFSSLPLIPPELSASDVTPYGTSVTGVSGTWTLKNGYARDAASGGDNLGPNPNGGTLKLERRSDTPTAAHGAWGGDGGDSQSNKWNSLPGNVRKDGGGGILTDKVAGYIRISEFDDTANYAIVGYEGMNWTNTNPATVELSGIVQPIFGGASVGSTPGVLGSWPAKGDVYVRMTAHGCHHLATRNVGMMGEATHPADNAPTLAQLAAQAPIPSVYQTNMRKLFDQIETSKALAGMSNTAPECYDLTVEDFFNRRHAKGSDSFNPFDTHTGDKNKIHAQYNAMKPEIVALAPVIWIEAVENMEVLSAYIDVQVDIDTSSASFPSDPEAASQGPSDSQDALGVSTLSWFDVTDLISSPDDLVDATVKIDRNDDLGQTTSVSMLRMFHVLEVSGISTTQSEFPTTLVVDVEGAGVSSPGGTVDGAELVRQFVVEGLGETAATVLNETSFATAGASTPDGGLALHEKEKADSVLHSLCESLRLVPTWDSDGKLAVSYLPDRSSLPSVDHTFVANDVIWGSVEVKRGNLGDIISEVLVRGGEDYVEGGVLFTSTSTVGSPQKINPVEYDAPALRTQAATDGLAAHLIDYARDVPLRVSWDMFIDGLDVFPGQLISLTTTPHTSAKLLVERVEINPSASSAAIVRVQCRDLST